MAVRALGAACSISYRLSRMSVLFPKPDFTPIRAHSLSLPIRWPSNLELRSGRKAKTLIHFVEVEDGSFTGTEIEGKEVMGCEISSVPKNFAMEKSEWFTDLVAALVCSFSISSLAVVAIYCRFLLQMEGEEVAFWEVFASFAVSVATAVGMEFWSKWVHKELWHDSLWNMHKSHHIPRKGQFELNDIFAVLNAVPAIALLSYGVFHIGFLPGLCFGAGCPPILLFMQKTWLMS